MTHPSLILIPLEKNIAHTSLWRERHVEDVLVVSQDSGRIERVALSRPSGGWKGKRERVVAPANEFETLAAFQRRFRFGDGPAVLYRWFPCPAHAKCWGSFDTSQAATGKSGCCSI
jgi:hypothetical protein